MSRFFDEDAEASGIARRFLREFSDEAIAWMPHLSSVHMDLVCDRLDTIPHVLIMAARYEMARRRAFPQISRPCRGEEPAVARGFSYASGAPHSEIGGNDVADGRGRLLGNRPAAPFHVASHLGARIETHSEIGAPVRSEAAGTGRLAPPGRPTGGC